MAIARTSKRLGLRTEASARFERGWTPRGSTGPSRRLCQILAETAGERFRSAAGVVDVRGPVPGPARVRVRTARVNAVLGSDLDDDAVVGYLEPIGFACDRRPAGVLDGDRAHVPARHRAGDRRHRGGGPPPRVQRPAPAPPVRPQVGGSPPTSASGGWCVRCWPGSGPTRPGPLRCWPGRPRPGRWGSQGRGARWRIRSHPTSRCSAGACCRGCCRPWPSTPIGVRASVRLFEVGHVFPPPGPDRVDRALARTGDTVIDEREMVAVALAGPGDDARSAAAAWQALADAFRIEDVEVVALLQATTPTPPRCPAGLHPTRAGVARRGGRRRGGPRRTIGVVGEVDPGVLAAFGLDSERRRVGWLEVDLAALLDRGADGAAPCCPR